MPDSSIDPLQQVLDATRQRFVTTFVEQCNALDALVAAVATLGSGGAVASLAQVTHRLGGLAGTIGFPTVSLRAAELEHLASDADTATFDGASARQAVSAIREAYITDRAEPPDLVIGTPRAGTAKILLAEDDADQRAIVTTCLGAAGYVPSVVASGDLVLDAARSGDPALILLDVAMPKLDGYSVCRLLKADSQLADIPVIFMTTRATLSDKLAGLSMGAEEFLSKPVDLRELILRIQLVLKRCRRPVPVPVPATVTVVVAEDDPDVRHLVDAHARAAGYTVILAADGEKALAEVRASTPDVLVLDLMMPRLSGFEVLAQLSTHPGTTRPRVLVLSGRGREADVLRAFELGADDYVTKPFNLQELMARITRLLK